MPKKSNIEENEEKKTTKKKEKIEESDNSKKKTVVRERVEKGPNGETIRIKETIIDEEDEDATSGSEKLINILTNKKFIIGVAAVLFFLILVIAILIATKPKPQPEYIYKKALKGDIYNAVDGGTTTLASSTTAIIKSSVTATVKEVKYKKGSTVKEGDTLLVLDSTFASDEVKKIENAISSMEKMLELYQRRNDELTVKARCDGYVTGIKVQKDSVVNIGDVLAYYVPTTTFAVEYNVTYDSIKKVTPWQTVNIKVAGYDNITGLVYNVDNSTMDQGYIKVLVYVNDSPINLSGQISTAEIVTSTGNLNSEGTGTFWNTVALPIYATQEGTVMGGTFEEGKKFQADATIFTLKNDEITSRVGTYQNDLTQLRREVAFRRSEVNDYVVKATSSGTVTSEPLQVGDSVIPNKELVQLRTTGLIEANVKVSAEDIQKINDGSDTQKKVIFNITGEKDKYVNGIVTFAEPYLSTDINQEYTVTVKVNEAEATEDIIGKTAKIEIVLEESTNVVYVPVKAIITEKNYNFVEVQTKTGGFEKRQVTIGIETPEYVEIKEGVNAGETVKVKNK